MSSSRAAGQRGGQYAGPSRRPQANWRRYRHEIRGMQRLVTLFREVGMHKRFSTIRASGASHAAASSTSSTAPLLKPTAWPMLPAKLLPKPSGVSNPPGLTKPLSPGPTTIILPPPKPAFTSAKFVELVMQPPVSGSPITRTEISITIPLVELEVSILEGRRPHRGPSRNSLSTAAVVEVKHVEGADDSKPMSRREKERLDAMSAEEATEQVVFSVSSMAARIWPGSAQDMQVNDYRAAGEFHVACSFLLYPRDLECRGGGF